MIWRGYYTYQYLPRCLHLVVAQNLQYPLMVAFSFWRVFVLAGSPEIQHDICLAGWQGHVPV